MNQLTELANKICSQNSTIEDWDNFCTTLGTSSEKEIVEMLEHILGQNILALPLGAKILSFRTLCFLAPDNQEYKHWAENMTTFTSGPWLDNKIKW
jgi:hypothetical protein